MGKRRKRSKADPCAQLRKQLDDINKQIMNVMNQLSEPDIPVSVRKKLEALLKRLQGRRAQIVKDLAKCEMMHARRHRTR